VAHAQRSLRLAVALAALWLAAAVSGAWGPATIACATASPRTTRVASPSPNSPRAANASPAPAPEYTRTTKISLIRVLTSAPQLVILGSSRAMRIAPDYVQRLTGYAGFNASVTSGSIADAYCFARFIHDSFPGSTQRYIWLVDVEQFRLDTLREGTLGQPELAQYLPEWALAAGVASDRAAPRARKSDAAAAQDPAATSGSAAHNVIGDQPAAPTGTPSARYGNEAVWLANGYLLWNRWDYLRRHGRTLKMGVAQSVRKYRLIYPRAYTRLCSTPRRLAEETIRLMNEWGVQPVIVLSPYHPRLLTRIVRWGADVRRDRVLAFFEQLQAQGSSHRAR